ncbi:MAG: citryl-CoA lyase [Candidatus Hodarchaeales archaeon]
MSFFRNLLSEKKQEKSTQERRFTAMGKKWETKITSVKPNELLVRGYPLDELIGDISYAAGIFLILRGELPSPSEERVINAILVALIDHGVTAPSAVTARSVASCGVPITTAMASGILAVGDHHGGAGERCMEFLQNELKTDIKDIPQLAKKVVEKTRAQKIRIPGFGHRFHTNDPRTTKLLQVAEEAGISGKYAHFAKLISEELSKQSGRSLPLNVDGAIGALLADMNFPPELGKAFFAISRITGITAHILEEVTTQRPMRTIMPEDSSYTGLSKRKVD